MEREKVELQSCFDCGSDDIMCDVERWKIVCCNCTEDVLLPEDKQLTKDDLIRFWNQAQNAKEYVKEVCQGD